MNKVRQEMLYIKRLRELSDKSKELSESIEGLEKENPHGMIPREMSILNRAVQSLASNIEKCRKSVNQESLIYTLAVCLGFAAEIEKVIIDESKLNFYMDSNPHQTLIEMKHDILSMIKELL